MSEKQQLFVPRASSLDHHHDLWASMIERQPAWHNPRIEQGLGHLISGHKLLYDYSMYNLKLAVTSVQTSHRCGCVLLNLFCAHACMRYDIRFMHKLKRMSS